MNDERYFLNIFSLSGQTNCAIKNYKLLRLTSVKIIVKDYQKHQIYMHCQIYER